MRDMRINWTAVVIVAIGSLALVWLAKLGHIDAALISGIVSLAGAAQAQKAVRRHYTRATDFTVPTNPAEAPTTFTKAEAPTSPSKPPVKP